MPYTRASFLMPFITLAPTCATCSTHGFYDDEGEKQKEKQGATLRPDKGGAPDTSTQASTSDAGARLLTPATAVFDILPPDPENQSFLEKIFSTPLPQSVKN